MSTYIEELALGLKTKVREFLFEYDEEKFVVGLQIMGLHISALWVKVDELSKELLINTSRLGFVKQVIRESVLLAADALDVDEEMLVGEYKRNENWVIVTPRGITPFSSLREH